MQFPLVAPLEGELLLLLASAGTVAWCVTAGVPTSSLDSVAIAEVDVAAVAAVELAIWMGAPLFWLLLEALIEARSGASEADGAKSGAALGSLAVMSDADMLGRRQYQLWRTERIHKKEKGLGSYISTSGNEKRLTSVSGVDWIQRNDAAEMSCTVKRS